MHFSTKDPDLVVLVYSIAFSFSRKTVLLIVFVTICFFIFSAKYEYILYCKTAVVE